MTARPRRASSRQPSPHDIEQVMDELRPLLREVPNPNDPRCTWATREEQEAECRDWISMALAEIASPRRYAGQMKNKLKGIAEAWLKARKAASDLTDDVMSRLGFDDAFLAELDRVAKTSGEWSDRIVGGRTSHTVVPGEHARMAASWAHRLLVVFTNRRPTSYRDGDYISIATTMHEVATGKRRHVERACLKVIQEVRAWPDALGEPEPQWMRVGPH